MRTSTAAPSLALAAVALVGCASTVAPPDAHATDWESLKAAMVGTFTSRAQSKADPRNYQDVRLVMTNIWPGRTDGYWLYVEQSLASDTAHPYRQRVYCLTPENDGTFRTTVYSLPGDPVRFSDGSGQPRGFETIAVSQLTQRGGCDIVLRVRSDGSFEGGTVGGGCPNELTGASYATSAVRISPQAIVAWDRGFDSGGRQVWGATKGGYVFRRSRDLATAAPR